MQYAKLPLSVEARFFTSGLIYPRKLHFAAKQYTIDRVISQRPHNPGTVSCITPIEYVVMIEGQTKKIYFEPETHQWFSIKECKERDFRTLD